MPMWQNLFTFVIATKQITRFKNPIPMNKGTSFISEICKYFKENDATSEQDYGDNTYVELLGEKALRR